MKKGIINKNSFLSGLMVMGVTFGPPAVGMASDVIGTRHLAKQKIEQTQVNGMVHDERTGQDITADEYLSNETGRAAARGGTIGGLASIGIAGIALSRDTAPGIEL